MGSHVGNAKASTLAHNDGKWEPTAAEQKQAVRPSSSWSEHHGRLDWVTQHRGQIAPRASYTTTYDGQTSHSASQTTPSRN
jgi:hypothetical protein